MGQAEGTLSRFGARTVSTYWDFASLCVEQTTNGMRDGRYALKVCSELEKTPCIEFPILLRSHDQSWVFS